MKYDKWLRILTPLYGERETRNMWRWYLEARRPEDMFDEDLKRLTEYYPIQYLTNYAWFYGEKFYVNEHTLIPRPETEELVFKILEDHPADQNLSAIDLGTGTGCIPITLKIHRPGWEVAGLELYQETMNAARKNAQLHNVSIQWIQGNMLDLSRVLTGSYDIMVSNPPYIPVSEQPRLHRNVLDYEPYQALFTKDDDGLEYYRAISDYAHRHALPGAEIYLELHENNAEKISDLFNSDRLFSNPEIFQDMQGKDRILKVNRR